MAAMATNGGWHPENHLAAALLPHRLWIRKSVVDKDGGYGCIKAVVDKKIDCG